MVLWIFSTIVFLILSIVLMYLCFKHNLNLYFFMIGAFCIAFTMFSASNIVTESKMNRVGKTFEYTKNPRVDVKVLEYYSSCDAAVDAYRLTDENTTIVGNNTSRGCYVVMLTDAPPFTKATSVKRIYSVDFILNNFTVTTQSKLSK